MCIKLVNKHGMLLSYIPDKMKTEAICFAATQKDVRAFRYVPESKQTRQLCLLVHQKLKNLFGEVEVVSISNEEFRDLCHKALEKIGW